VTSTWAKEEQEDEDDIRGEGGRSTSDTLLDRAPRGGTMRPYGVLKRIGEFSR
jgi:hypothetical protein